MSRSKLRESQVVDSDFLSEEEHANLQHTFTYNWTPISGTYTATNGDKLLIDATPGAFAITLPANPVKGNNVSFLDGEHICGTNNVTISGNGEKIYGLNEPLVMDVDGAYFDLVYSSATVGWGFIH